MKYKDIDNGDKVKLARDTQTIIVTVQNQSYDDKTGEVMSIVDEHSMRWSLGTDATRQWHIEEHYPQQKYLPGEMFTVWSSDGKKLYIITWEGILNDWKCTCEGFRYRAACRHVTEHKRMLADGVHVVY